MNEEEMKKIFEEMLLLLFKLEVYHITKSPISH